jgi:VWFA-related protein
VRSAWTAAVAGAGLWAVAGAAVAVGQGEHAPTLKLFANEVAVDVIVTDGRGRPVHGLTREDFALKQDGKVQAVRDVAESAAAGEPGVTNAAMSSGPVNLILLDVLNTADSGLMVVVKEGVVEYLKTMPRGTRVAVFGLSGKTGLTMLQGLTVDGTTAAASVERLDVEWVRGPLNGTAARMTLEAMRQLAAYLAVRGGRKNLVWFTAQMPINIVRDGGLVLDPNPPRLLTYREVSELYDRLTEEQVAIYPIDAHGLGTSAWSVSGATGTGAANRPIPSYFGESMGREHHTEKVAAESGGLMQDNSSDFKGLLAKAIEHGSNYYTLTFVPTAFVTDTRYHAIEVKVARPGMRLLYREGYNAATPARP